MFSLKIQNAKGELFELSHNHQNYVITNVEGLTVPQIVNNVASGGTVDGAFYNSSRMETRNIVITVRLVGDIEGNRQRLYKMFSLKKSNTIFFKNENRDLKIIGYVEVIEGDLFTEAESIQISIICPRPYWENAQTISEELSYTIKQFKFPFAIESDDPIPLSEYTSTPLVEVLNRGDVECGAIFTVTFSGTVENLIIYNTTNQQAIGFNATFTEFSGVLTIDTRAGYLAAYRTNGATKTNLINKLIDGAKWIKLDVGVNELTFLTSSGGNNVNITIEAAELYGGV
jgi:hypothetical protein